MQINLLLLSNIRTQKMSKTLYQKFRYISLTKYIASRERGERFYLIYNILTYDVFLNITWFWNSNYTINWFFQKEFIALVYIFIIETTAY